MDGIPKRAELHRGRNPASKSQTLRRHNGRRHPPDANSMPSPPPLREGSHRPTANSPNVTGRFSNGRPGGVRRPRSNGESTASRLPPWLPLERRRLLPPASQGRRRLPRSTRNSLVRAADDRNVGARRPAGASPQKDPAALGRAAAHRSERRAQTAQLSLERRGRWQTTVMVRRPSRKLAGRRNRVSQDRDLLGDVAPSVETLTAFDRFSIRA